MIARRSATSARPGDRELLRLRRHPDAGVREGVVDALAGREDARAPTR